MFCSLVTLTRQRQQYSCLICLEVCHRLVAISSCVHISVRPLGRGAPHREGSVPPQRGPRPAATQMHLGRPAHRGLQRWKLLGLPAPHSAHSGTFPLVQPGLLPTSPGCWIQPLCGHMGQPATLLGLGAPSGLLMASVGLPRYSRGQQGRTLYQSPSIRFLGDGGGQS